MNNKAYYNFADCIGTRGNDELVVTLMTLTSVATSIGLSSKVLESILFKKIFQVFNLIYQLYKLDKDIYMY